MQSAAIGRKEPTPDLLILCCVRLQRQKMRYERRLPCRREAKESVIGVVRSMDQPAHLQVEIFNCFCEERAVIPTSSETKGRRSVLQIGY